MPQPIDPTTEIGRTMAVERIQQMTTRADLAGQARLASELARQQLAAETEVDKPEAKSDEVNRDLKRHNPYSGRRKRKRQPAPAPPPTKETRTFYNAHERPDIADDEEHHGLDIKA